MLIVSIIHCYSQWESGFKWEKEFHEILEIVATPKLAQPEKRQFPSQTNDEIILTDEFPQRIISSILGGMVLVLCLLLSLLSHLF